MCNVYRSIICLKPDELVKAFYLSVGKFFPDYKGLELGIGDGMLNKAVAKATGLSEK
jgi:DNA ligase-1